MSSVAGWFHSGGWSMYLLLLLGMLAVPASLVLPAIGAFVRGPRLAVAFSVALLGLGATAVAVGAFGQHTGMRMVEEAIAYVHPEDAEAIRSMGSHEARTPLVFGLIVALLPFVAGAGMAGVALGRALEGRVRWPFAAAGLLWALGICAVLAGTVARQSGVRQAEGALAHAAPDHAAALRAHGMAEADAAGALGRKAGLPLLGLGIAACGLGVARRRRE